MTFLSVIQRSHQSPPIHPIQLQALIWIGIEGSLIENLIQFSCLIQFYHSPLIIFTILIMSIVDLCPGCLMPLYPLAMINYISSKLYQFQWPCLREGGSTSSRIESNYTRNRSVYNFSHGQTEDNEGANRADQQPDRQHRERRRIRSTWTNAKKLLSNKQ